MTETLDALQKRITELVSTSQFSLDELKSIEVFIQNAASGRNEEESDETQDEEAEESDSSSTELKEGIIYKISSSRTDKIYYGSTTQTIEERFREHVAAYRIWVRNKKRYPYMTSFEIVQYDDAEMELVVTYPYYDISELARLEQCYIDTYANTVNTHVPSKVIKAFYKEKRKRFVYRDIKNAKDITKNEYIALKKLRTHTYEERMEIERYDMKTNGIDINDPGIFDIAKIIDECKGAKMSIDDVNPTNDVVRIINSKLNVPHDKLMDYSIFFTDMEKLWCHYNICTFFFGAKRQLRGWDFEHDDKMSVLKEIYGAYHCSIDSDTGMVKLSDKDVTEASGKALIVKYESAFRGRRKNNDYADMGDITRILCSCMRNMFGNDMVIAKRSRPYRNGKHPSVYLSGINKEVLEMHRTLMSFRTQDD